MDELKLGWERLNLQQPGQVVIVEVRTTIDDRRGSSSLLEIKVPKFYPQYPFMVTGEYKGCWRQSAVRCSSVGLRKGGGSA